MASDPNLIAKRLREQRKQVKAGSVKQCSTMAILCLRKQKHFL